MDEEKGCGTCRYHEYYKGEWCCLCEYSFCYGIETEYSDSCEDWEEK